MTVLGVLFLIFVFLATSIFQKKALFLVTGLFINVLLFILYLVLLHLGFAVYPVTFTTFLAVSAVTLFYVNGFNKRTKIAFSCVLLFLVTFTLLIFPLIHLIRTQGFSAEELEELSMMDFNVAVPFTQLNVSMIIMSFSGAVIDGSMAISSATYELYQNAPHLAFKDLVKASLSIVVEALNSTIYTLLFAFIGSSLALIIWLQDLHYPFSELINSKVFVNELLISGLTGIAAILCLPLTAFFGSYLFVKKSNL